jgi:hypothetical protein
MLSPSYQRKQCNNFRFVKHLRVECRHDCLIRLKRCIEALHRHFRLFQGHPQVLGERESCRAHQTGLDNVGKSRSPSELGVSCLGLSEDIETHRG